MVSSNLTDPDGAPLAKTDTIGSISLTPEQFERMYLGPQNEVKGDLRKTFANPTPIGLGGLLLALTPITMQFMGWRGTTGGEGIPTVGFSFFLGGVLPILASILEFILGNSFPALFLSIFGGFFLAYAATLTPAFNAYAAFSAHPNNPALALKDGPAAPQFAGSIAFVAVFMGLISTMMLIAALRTNLVFVMAFTCLSLAFYFLAASRFYLVQLDMDNYEHYEFIAGACGFTLCILGWYLLFSEILTTVDFPYNVPVFDLSGYIPSATELRKKQMAAKNQVNGGV